MATALETKLLARELRRTARQQARPELAKLARYLEVLLRIDFDGPVPEHCPELGPCHVWLGYRGPGGYGRVMIDGHQTGAHRYMYEVANGRVPSELVVMHKCDNPPCVRRDHLTVGTRADNVADRQAKGRSARGSRCGNVWLTKAQAEWLRVQNLVEKRSLQELADELHISECHASYIVTGRSWKSAGGPISKGLRVGDQHPTRLRPELLHRGEAHWTRQKPERLARGDANGSRLHPEKRKRGEEQRQSKLTKPKVRRLRRLAAKGVSYKELGRQFKVSDVLARLIVKRKAWAHVT